MSEIDYPTRLTTQIQYLNSELIKEHRSWRAFEIKGELKGLEDAMSTYYRYGYDCLCPKTKEKES